MKIFKNYLLLGFDKAFLLSFLITLAFFVILRVSHGDYTNLKIILIVLILALIYLIRNKKIISIALGVLSAITSIIVLYYLIQIFKTFNTIREYDFFAFYLFGKVGVSGLDFYDPINFSNILSTIKTPFEISPEFYEEIVNVGFLYPPITMIIFAPLGYMELTTANIVWTISVGLFLITDIILLTKIFRTNNSHWVNLIFILVLTLIFPGTNPTLFFCQTTFLLLFFLLLAFRNLANWKCGLFLALAVTIKPIAAIWCLYLLINKKWTSLISLIITGALITLFAGILFGFGNYLSYLNSPPVLRIPQWLYTEGQNYSLLAEISRFWTKSNITSSIINVKDLVMFLSLILLIVSCIASYKLAKSSQSLSFLIFIPLSLLIYPGSGNAYSVFLIPVFLEILSLKNYYNLRLFSTLILILFLTTICTHFISILSLLCIILAQFICNRSWSNTSKD